MCTCETSEIQDDLRNNYRPKHAKEQAQFLTELYLELLQVKDNCIYTSQYHKSQYASNSFTVSTALASSVLRAVFIKQFGFEKSYKFKNLSTLHRAKCGDKVSIFEYEINPNFCVLVYVIMQHNAELTVIVLQLYGLNKNKIHYNRQDERTG